MVGRFLERAVNDASDSEARESLAAAADDATAGEVTARRIIELMRATRIPNGLGGVGLDVADAGALADSAARQVRAVANSPRRCSRDDIEGICARAVSYW